jgi:hypothetical protein
MLSDPAFDINRELAGAGEFLVKGAGTLTSSWDTDSCGSEWNVPCSLLTRVSGRMGAEEVVAPERTASWSALDQS